jgi:hypothetical protein
VNTTWVVLNWYDTCSVMTMLSRHYHEFAFASSVHYDVKEHKYEFRTTCANEMKTNMKEGIEWERYTTRTKSIHDNEILGLPRLLFVPLNNVEPAQFGNPAERRLLEIPDARVCTVHCLYDRQEEHFRSSSLLKN